MTSIPDASQASKLPPRMPPKQENAKEPTKGPEKAADAAAKPPVDAGMELQAVKLGIDITSAKTVGQDLDAFFEKYNKTSYNELSTKGKSILEKSEDKRLSVWEQRNSKNPPIISKESFNQMTMELQSAAEAISDAISEFKQIKEKFESIPEKIDNTGKPMPKVKQQILYHEKKQHALTELLPTITKEIDNREKCPSQEETKHHY